MKKLFSVLLIILFFGGFAFASPFMVCDPDPNTHIYVITYEDGTKVETPAPLHFDLADASEGKTVLTVHGKNHWGQEGPSVPFEFTRALPLSPTNTRLSMDDSQVP